MEYTQQPAFPPQVAQDNLGRIIAPIPGMSKLEYFAIMLLPTMIEIDRQQGSSIKGKYVSPAKAAVQAAKNLLKELNESDETPTLQLAE
jgi:hypothetical protein